MSGGLDVQHDTAHGEATLGLHAIRAYVFVVHDVAALGDVPGGARIPAQRVDGVGRGLDVDAVCPDGEQGDMQEDGEDGEEDVEEPQSGFDQVKEHAHYADYKVVLSVTG